MSIVVCWCTYGAWRKAEEDKDKEEEEEVGGPYDLGVVPSLSLVSAQIGLETGTTTIS